jgi:hypothetical protein
MRIIHVNKKADSIIREDHERLSEHSKYTHISEFLILNYNKILLHVMNNDVQSDAADTCMCIKDSESVFSEEGCTKNLPR